jgi:hypothetical protein
MFFYVGFIKFKKKSMLNSRFSSTYNIEMVLSHDINIIKQAMEQMSGTIGSYKVFSMYETYFTTKRSSYWLSIQGVDLALINLILQKHLGASTKCVCDVYNSSSSHYSEQQLEDILVFFLQDLKSNIEKVFGEKEYVCKTNCIDA